MLPLDESADLADTSISGPAACAAAGEDFSYLRRQQKNLVCPRNIAHPSTASMQSAAANTL